MDQKRFQERIRNDFEEGKRGRAEKKDTKPRRIDHRDTQESPKNELPRAWQPILMDLEAQK